MLASSIPVPFALPFAADAVGGDLTNPIPIASQIGIKNGAASLTDGFPPLCFTLVSAGGTWMYGADLNGILYEITNAVQFIQAGGMPLYNSTFSTAIGGYPNGAVLQKASYFGFWQSTIDNNTSDPDTGGANWIQCNAQLYNTNIWTKAQSGAFYSVAPVGSGSTLTLDFSKSNNFIINGVSANFILGNPTNITPGQSGCITFVQNGTGGYVLSGRGNLWLGNNGARVNLTAGASGKDNLFYCTDYNGTITLTGAGNVS